MRWPERRATVLAIEIVWPSATIVSAKARPTSSDACAQLMRGNSKRGHGVAMAPTVRSADEGVVLPAVQRPQAHDSAVATASPISM